MELIFSSLIGADKEASGNLALGFHGNDGKIYNITLAPETRNALLGLLLSVVQQDGANERSQPMRLTSVRAATGPQMEPLLELSLENLPIIVALDPKGLPALRAALTQLDQIVSANPGERH